MAGIIVFQSFSANSASGAAGSLNVTHPPGLAVGDLILAVMHDRQGFGTIWDTPSGWVNEGSSHNVAANSRDTIFSKTADAADVAAGSTTFTLTTGSFRLIGILMRWIGHDPVIPVNAIGFLGQSVAAGSPANWQCPDVNTTVVNTTILRVSAIGEEDTIGVTQVLAGATERASKPFGTAEVEVFEVNDVQAVIGATGAVNIEITGGSGVHDGHGITIALAQALGGGGIMGGDNPAILQPGRELIERAESPPRILNPFGPQKRHCMCPIGKCTCI